MSFKQSNLWLLLAVKYTSTVIIYSEWVCFLCNRSGLAWQWTNSPKWNKQLTACVFFYGLQSSWHHRHWKPDSLSCRLRCLPVTLLCPNRSTTRVQFKTNICTSLPALPLFSHITFNSLQVIRAGRGATVWMCGQPKHNGWKCEECCQFSFVLFPPFSQHWLPS